MFASREALDEVLPKRVKVREAQPFVHVLTHKDLHLHPVEVALPSGWNGIEGRWFGRSEWPALGLPAPVRKLLGNF